MDVLEVIKRRRSVPRFTPDPVPRAVVERMLEAATWAPNHHLTEPWAFIVLEGPAKAPFAEIRRAFRLSLFPDPESAAVRAAADKIAEQTLQTPTIIIVTTTRPDDPERRADDFAATFCAIQNMLLVAAAAGVGTYLRTGGLVHDPALHRWLGLEPARRVAGIVYVGYPAVIPERRRTPYPEKTTWITRERAAAADGAQPAPVVAGAVQARSEEGAAVAIDPVCQMEVDVAAPAATSVLDGVTYYFCAPGCKTLFDADPARYLGRPGGHA